MGEEFWEQRDYLGFWGGGRVSGACFVHHQPGFGWQTITRLSRVATQSRAPPCARIPTGPGGSLVLGSEISDASMSPMSLSRTARTFRDSNKC